MAAYTHYWSNQTFIEAKEGGETNLPLNHVASNIFVQRGVREGDNIYVVTVVGGAIFLVGRLTAAKIVHSDAEAEALLGYTPWSAADHVIADDDGCTPMNFECQVPLEIVKELR